MRFGTSTRPRRPHRWRDVAQEAALRHALPRPGARDSPWVVAWRFIRARLEVYEVRGSPDNPPAHIRFSKANRFALDDRSLSESLGSTGPGQYEVKGTVDASGRHGRSFGASHRAYDRVRLAWIGVATV